ncbi:hypothetical protein [Pseudovibrio brasiliensis]|uniref:Intracellular septation protein A n=1 Tax=Pseudovibrio brasiliensis TaxID=1898042 RepID=A0ABX8AK93_9HYPH|nr:hypothetical protein [Pseudovibrio brasiliensis]QUS55505.1 hypothetical protein KGB56_19640 [Pseudovibrio brasiliensis]
MPNAKSLWRVEKIAVTYGIIYILLYLSIWLVFHYTQELFSVAITANSLPTNLLVISGIIIGFNLFRSNHQKIKTMDLCKLALACSACAYLFVLVFKEATNSTILLHIIEQYFSKSGLVGNGFDLPGFERELLIVSPLSQTPLDFTAHFIFGLVAVLFSGFGIEFSVSFGLLFLLLLHFLGMALCSALGLVVGKWFAEKLIKTEG